MTRSAGGSCAFKRVARWLAACGVLKAWAQGAAVMTSMSAEDQVLSALALAVSDAPMWAVDTNKLFSEVVTLSRALLLALGWRLRTKHAAWAWALCLKAGACELGVRDGLTSRLTCCELRKVAVASELKLRPAWAAGLRAAHSEARLAFSVAQWDAQFGCLKLCPLALWRLEDVFGAVDVARLSYNSLHDCGFASVGCEPCTRAVKAGERARAGRWWWERATCSRSECGLHAI
ncbi:putative adenylylsulfate reductase [Candidatus Hodgkinia cicadicola Dsem]|nr:putative adenylylsulfate reductase [Candidatus Hodgkinia cicadicola Dsem]